MDTPRFKISTFCRDGGCVGVTVGPDDSVIVANTANTSRAVSFTAVEWDAFLAGVKAGEFDRARL